MPKGKYIRYRMVDVGRKGHHYIKIGVRKTKGKSGGYTEKVGGLKTYKNQLKELHKNVKMKGSIGRMSHRSMKALRGQE